MNKLSCRILVCYWAYTCPYPYLHASVDGGLILHPSAEVVEIRSIGKQEPISNDVQTKKQKEQNN